MGPPIPRSYSWSCSRRTSLIGSRKHSQTASIHQTAKRCRRSRTSRGSDGHSLALLAWDRGRIINASTVVSVPKSYNSPIRMGRQDLRTALRIFPLLTTELLQHAHYRFFTGICPAGTRRESNGCICTFYGQYSVRIRFICVELTYILWRRRPRIPIRMFEQIGTKTSWMHKRLVSTASVSPSQAYAT